MNIIVDIWHPADVHFFKNIIWRLEKEGHKILVTSRQKDMIVPLLDEYNIKHEILTKKGKGFFGLLKELVVHDYRLYKLAKKFKPDILLAFGGMSISHVGILINRPSIGFYDSEHAKLIKLVTLPFITKMCTPFSYGDDYGKIQVRFNSFKEIAYLHPKYHLNNKINIEKLGLNPEEKYYVLRFVSWDASHDFGAKGIELEYKLKLVQLLKTHGRVLISAEDNLVPRELEPYLTKTKPTDFFDLLANSSLVISEGGSTATEAGILGVPCIYINPISCGQLEEVKKYGLIEQIVDGEKLLNRITAILSDQNIKLKWKRKRDRLLKEKIDLVEWVVDYINKEKFR